MKNGPDLHQEVGDSDAAKIHFVTLAVARARRDFEHGPLRTEYSALNPDRYAATESRIFGFEERVDIELAERASALAARREEILRELID